MFYAIEKLNSKLVLLPNFSSQWNWKIELSQMHCGIYIQCSMLCMNTAIFVKYTVIDYICIPESKSIVQQLSAEYKK